MTCSQPDCHRMNTRSTLLLFLAFFSRDVVAEAPLNAAATLPPGAKLAVIGDSITEQKLYSRYIEAYLVACAGRADVHVFQFGWGGETAGGFAGRAANDLSIFHPTTVTLCYGMNDGSYRPFDEKIGKNYEGSMRNVLNILKANGVVHVVVGSPGAVDTFYFKNKNFGSKSGADGYNENLAQLGMIGKKLAGEFQQPFADVHQPMIDAMSKAKPVFGENYDVCGRDGVHPGPNGQLIMASAFLKGLGCNGDIGTITIDMNGPATATAGHKVVSSSAGAAELESERYPFCLQGDDKSSNGTRSIAPHIGFNEQLNRYTLKVTNLNAAKAKVEWGGQAKEFTKEQLTSGINLADFPATPFDSAFNSYLDKLGEKQGFETVAIKQLVTNFRQISKDAKADPELASALKNLGEKLAARQAALDTLARKAITPVKHSLKVTPL